MFKDSLTRIKTGILLALGVFFIGYFNNLPLLWIFFGALMIGGVFESFKLFKIENKFFITSLLSILWIFIYKYPNPGDIVFLGAVILASILAYNKKLDKKLFLPLLYPFAPFLFLFMLYKDFGILALVWLLFVVAGADIGAYFVGKSIGKTKFSPTSPNKTIEGVIGGIVTASIFGVFFSTIGSFIDSLVISFLVAVSSVFGDLFESYLKREANVKDSGNLLPGHGGILDRVDGYLFGGIILYIILKVY